MKVTLQTHDWSELWRWQANIVTTIFVDGRQKGVTTIREANKKKKVPKLGHCPNREGGWLRIKLIFQSVYEIF